MTAAAASWARAASASLLLLAACTPRVVTPADTAERAEPAASGASAESAESGDPVQRAAPASDAPSVETDPGEAARDIAAAPAERASPALDFDGHVAKLRRRLPHDGFHIVVQPPFVVVGDEAPETVARRAERTVAWAVRLLKEAYFERDPDHVIDVWLFKNRASYMKHTRELFGDRPTTPFGYYSPMHRALIMNIATGGGTLVHEIVHPFVRANFPACPAWFNEGLGSLYEQCAERDGKITGLTNWRLAGLQEAIRDGRVPTFEALCSTTTAEFYDRDRGTNYAQARYLCYYLQQNGLLRDYYRRFRAARRADPTGYATLVEVLGRDAEEMAAFQAEWQAWVLGLRY